MTTIHKKLTDCHPSLQRGQVWCRNCSSTQKVDSANAFQHGWPKCCGYTMTIDHPNTWSKPNDHQR